MSDVVLVTGASGMLGTAVMGRLALEPHGAQLIAPTRRDLDLLDARQVMEWFAEHRPQTVLHLAGHVRGLAQNMGHQVDGLVLNARMTLNVAEAAAAFPPQRMVLAGSNAAYAHPYPHLPLREDDLLAGDVHPGEYGYAWANRTMVAAAESLRRDTAMEVSVALLTNLFGPGDRFDAASGHVIPALIERFCTAADQGTPGVVVWGRPDTTRDFLYVDDAADAVLAIVGAADAPLVVNAASGTERTMGSVAMAIAAATGFTGRIAWDDSMPVGIPRRAVDVSRLRHIHPADSVGFDEGLRRTIAWYRDRR